MKSYTIILVLVITPLLSIGQNGRMTKEKYREDFNYFWKTINEEYCYFDKKQTDWQKVKEVYGKYVDTITERDQFVDLLERALNELYDHHAILNTNTYYSKRLVPSGTDIWAEYVNDKPIVIEVRKRFGADSCGIIPGMEITALNDIPIEMLVTNYLPVSLKRPDIEARNFALRLLLAGDHINKRKFTLRYKGNLVDCYPDKNGMQLENIRHSANLESRWFEDIGYIKINDCLYNAELIPAFDSVMQTMQKSSSLIIDLRETPSGGNTMVAKAIISWFITKDHFYQKHEYPAEQVMSGVKRSWVEIVSPRKDKTYTKPLVVLCNHWTASVGEGTVIGFDALERPFTKIIGTNMAQLNGAVYSFQMPNSKIGFTFPAEKLFTVKGIPREKYKPPVFIELNNQGSQKDTDIFISRALNYLKSLR